MHDIMQMQRDAEARMDRLLTAMKPPEPKETFTLRDFIAMQERQEDRTQRLVERLEASTERRMADLKEVKGKGNTTLEALREAKEIAGLLGGESAQSGVFEKLVEAATSQEFWQGFGDFVATVKSGPMAGEEEQEQEEQPIEVNERVAAPQAPQPPQPRPAAPPRPPKPRAAPQVKPEDMGLTDYPETMGPAVAQLVAVSTTEATDADGMQAQIVAVMGCLQAAMNGSPEWKMRVFTGLRRVAYGGPKQVTIWIGPFIRGLAKSGKITLSSSEILLKVVEVNSPAIVGWVKKKMSAKAPPAAQAPAAQ